MQAISSLFDETELVVLQGKPRPGGVPLPENVRVMPVIDPKRQGVLPQGLRGHFITILFGADWGSFIPSGRYSQPITGRHLIDWPADRIDDAQTHHWPLMVAPGKKPTITTRMNKVTKKIMERFAGGRNVMLATGLGETPPSPKMHWLFVSVISKGELASINPNLSKSARKTYENGLRRASFTRKRGNGSPPGFKDIEK